MNKGRKSKDNPNATFIEVTIENRKIFAYVDTGASICFGKRKIIKNWEKLKKPTKIVIADKSVHKIWYVARMVPIYINKVKFITPTIYMHDSGIDLIIGNNFLKLYQPFTQTDKSVIIKHKETGKLVSTPIVTQIEYVRMLARDIKFQVEILLTMKKEHIERALEEVCSENPLDKINTNNQLVSIKLKDPLAEINIPNRIPYSIKDVKEFKEECQQLLNKGIIRESSSPHSAPAFYVENNNEVKRGKRRMVINYKKMNDATIGDSYKLPRKDYILEKLKGNTHFSTFDAKSGYWQLRLDESTKPLTAFSCPPQKHYEWNVLPFGLKQAPSIYQRFMDNNLQGLESFCLAYIDDIIVFTKGDEQDHIKAVSTVLKRIKEKGLILSQKKSKLLQNEVEYLGLKIAKNGIISLTNNTQEKLKLFPDKLEDRKQIQRFLGCLNYIAEQGFLKNLAKERKALQKKISEKIRWEWTPSDTQLVQNIKTNVQCLPELYNPETKDFLIVETDASDDTWAGCMKAIQNGKELLGLDIDGIPIPQSNLSKVLSIDGSQIPQSDSVLLNSSLQVSSNEQTSVLKTEKYKSKLCKYISGTFSETEQKYSTHEKETLACLKTLKKWKIDLLQTRFELRTDSKYGSINPLATTTTPIPPIYKIHQKQQQHLCRYPHKRMEGILKQAQHHLQQKREQVISLEKQLTIAREEEEKLANTVQYLTQTTTSESTSESTPSPSKPSTPIKSRPSKTQESESPSSRKNEFIKIEEDVEEIVQNSSIGKQKWYVIFNGPFKGIYSDWALASPHIIGKSVSHKSYTSQEEAKQALKESYKTVTTEEVQKSRRFISLNQRLQEKSPRINPIDLIRSIPTTREREEMKKPSVEKFQRLWDSVIHYDEVQATKSFYPSKRPIGPKVVFLPGAAPTDVHEYFVHGLVDTIYTDGTTIREFQEFPIQVQNIIKTYNALFAHHRPLYFKLHSSYPVFDNNNHKLLVPSITLAELGVSNDVYPPKYELRDDLPPAIPSSQNLVDALAGVFFASLKLGTGTRQKSDIKINYSKNNMLIYSKYSKGTIDDEQLKVLADFEEPFEKFTEPLSILPEDFKIALCQKLFHISRHVCEYCTASQMQQ
ncbi:reverse transcriptase [Artemisia annua]|uniref:RNA-directed DNA polymerase n=1 Tax=Artemisia annua TaxID=35608 RepID=A0A2U1MFH9_ARTAN|nr:reverse transcriptase [Artemisia annua]